MDNKAEYFQALYALNDNADEEEDRNYLRDLLKQSKPPARPSPLSSLQPVPERRSRITSAPKKVPALHRTTSAPVSSVSTVKEPPALPRKSSLIRHDNSASITPETSFNSETALTGQHSPNRPPTECRTVSTPSIGSVHMTNSTGIADMLKKKTRKEAPKRKAFSISLVPEQERIFQGQTFYFVPPDDVAPLRRLRITKSQTYGAIWTKEWVDSITHVIVDKKLNSKQVLDFLHNTLKLEVLTSKVILVNEDYPLDCIRFMHLLNPDQPQYRLPGSETVAEVQEALPDLSQPSPNSVKLKKQRSRKGDSVSHSSSPVAGSIEETSQGVWIASRQSEDNAELAESPHETSPISDVRYESFGTELDKMIGVARRLQQLPLDSDDEDERPCPGEDPEDSEQSGSESERTAAQAASRKKRRYNKGSFNQDSFSCMTGGTEIALESNPNRRTIEILQEMADYYIRMRDQWRSRAYRMAIGTLKKQSTMISTYEEACALPTIGHRLATKIEEIVLTNRLRRLDNAKLEPNDRTLQLFLKVYGVGVHQANAWIRAGYKTLEDVLTHASLTPNHRIGIEHYNDFATRIPREEVTTLGKIVKESTTTLDSSVKVVIGGSYRRGATSSGDIDCLITKPGTSSTKELLPFLGRLVARLTESRFLVAALAVPGDREESGSKWHGACVLLGSPNQIWRRIDFLLVPETEYGAALIYFTGDDIFNRSLRLLASKKDMRLNQRGLYKDVLRGPGRIKLSEGTLIEGADEKRIFGALGVPWRSPENRIMQ